MQEYGRLSVFCRTMESKLFLRARAANIRDTPQKGTDRITEIGLTLSSTGLVPTLLWRWGLHLERASPSAQSSRVGLFIPKLRQPRLALNGG